MALADLADQDYMRLADNVGVIPEKYRNRGYEKLAFKPGQGGIGGLLKGDRSRNLSKEDLLDAMRALVHELKETK